MRLRGWHVLVAAVELSSGARVFVCLLCAHVFPFYAPRLNPSSPTNLITKARQQRLLSPRCQKFASPCGYYQLLPRWRRDRYNSLPLPQSQFRSRSRSLFQYYPSPSGSPSPSPQCWIPRPRPSSRLCSRHYRPSQRQLLQGLRAPTFASPPQMAWCSSNRQTRRMHQGCQGLLLSSHQGK